MMERRVLLVSACRRRSFFLAAAIGLGLVPQDFAEQVTAASLSTAQHPREAHKVLDPWDDSDPVKVYYAEFLLANWVLDRAPWNAYHSALAFVNNRTEQKVLFDYAPEDVSSVMNMIIPDIRMGTDWQPYLNYLTGGTQFVWRDQAKTQFHPYWPTNYQNFVGLGMLNASVLKKFARWVEEEFEPSHHAFQPVEVAIQGQGSVVRSRMCHDFVTDALWVLYKEGITLEAEDTIFRDHIIMYASEVEDVTELVNSARGKRQWLRYLRGISLFLEEVKKQFTHARHALIVAWKLGLTVFLHNEHWDYNVRLVTPALNYCYLPLAMPPEVHDPFAPMKLCALGMSAQNNVTAPFPSGHVLATEERLDRTEPLIALIMIAFVSAVLVGSSNPPSK